jgi:Ca2+-binding RTX toxin-like protein
MADYDANSPHIELFLQSEITDSRVGAAGQTYDSSSFDGYTTTYVYCDPAGAPNMLPYTAADSATTLSWNINAGVEDFLKLNYPNAPAALSDLANWSLDGVYIGGTVGGGNPPSASYTPPPFQGSVTEDIQLSNVALAWDPNATYSDATAPGGGSFTIPVAQPAAASFDYVDRNSGMSGTVAGTSSTPGPFNAAYLDPGTDDLLITATMPDVLMEGGSGIDTLVAQSGGNMLIAGTGATYLQGGSGSDTFIGGAAAAGRGVDTVSAGTAGGLVIGGSAGLDVLGGAGSTTVWATGGASTMTGGSGGGLFIDGAGGSLIIAGSGAATIVGAQSDSLYGGGNGSDVLIAGGGAETLWSAPSGGTDVLYAGTGQDTLIGGQGKVTMVAGTGSADMLAGSGGNTFTFIDGMAGGSDTISGFTAGRDFLNLANYGPDAIANVLQSAVSSGGTTTFTLPDRTVVCMLGLASLVKSDFA